MSSEITSKSVASIAARGLRDPASLTLDEIQSVCASALTQRPTIFSKIAGLLRKRPAPS